MIYLDLLVRKNYKKNWIDQIEEAVSIYTTSNIEECKLIICDSTTFKKYKKVNKKIIIISITDGIIIENDWSVDNVKYIICHTKIKDKTKSLNPLLSKLSEIYSEKKENEVLDNFESISNKMKCILNTSDHLSNKFIENVPELKVRKIDVSMMCTLTFDEKVNTNPNRHLVSQHRYKLKEKIEELCIKNNISFFTTENKVDKKTYDDILLNTKIFICPYGTGEFTNKEYESICFGSQVLKPEIYFEQDLEFYKNFESFKLDLSNLENVIMNSLKNIDDIQLKVNQNRLLLRNHKLEFNIEEIRKLIDECLL